MVFRLRRARGNTHEDDEVLPNQPDPVSPEVGRLTGGSVAGLGGCRRLGGHNTGTGGQARALPRATAYKNPSFEIRDPHKTTKYG
jgi:hypothetical protein